MRLELKFLIIALIAAVAALPVALLLQGQAKELKIERSENNNLRLQIETKHKELEQKNLQIEQDKQKQLDLEKQLQTKREAEAKVAATRTQAPDKAPLPSIQGSGNCESYRPIVAQYNWDVSTALAIMRAESGCRPNAVSPTNDHGLMQINKGLAIYGQQIYDPAHNVRVAFENKYLKGGWSHWTVYNTGAYKKYL